MKMPMIRRSIVAPASTVATIAVVALSACSSSGNTSSGSAASQPASSAPHVATATFDGPSSRYFSDVPSPKTTPGTKFVLGFSDPYAAIPGLLAEQKAACAEAVKLGGSCISKDANVSVQTQVSQVNELLSQHVTALAIDPLDPQALAPSFTAAKNAKVPVVAADTPADTSQATNPLIAASISQAFDYSAWVTVGAAAKAMRGATFAILGTASPNPVLQYLLSQEKAYALAFGLKFAGQVDAQQDTPTQWSSAASTLAQKYPAMKLVLTYNDPSALAASSAIRASGRSDVKVADANGYSAAAKAAIQSGAMIASYAVPWTLKGKALADAAYEAQTRQSLSKIIALKGEAVTSANVNTVPTTG